MTYVFSLLLGYVLGSIPFGMVLARVFGLGDLRQVGSGNIGATNVLRTGSKKAAALTLLLDALKGTAAVLLAWWLFGSEAAALAGLAALIGHCFPVWLRFKGGKGVATFMGVLLGLNSLGFFVFCSVWLAVAAMSRFSSLAALVASVAGFLAVLITVPGQSLTVICVAAMVALLWWRHRENIARLRAGTESKISLGSKK